MLQSSEVVRTHVNICQHDPDVCIDLDIEAIAFVDEMEGNFEIEATEAR